MGTFTASILVGAGHPNDDGIIPVVVLYLSEGSKISWVMRRASSDSALTGDMIWLATVDHTLEDAMVMIAYFVMEDPDIRALVNSH